jgi:hypothetical protein
MAAPPPTDALNIVASLLLVAAAQQPSARRPRELARMRKSAPGAHLQIRWNAAVHGVGCHGFAQRSYGSSHACEAIDENHRDANGYTCSNILARRRIATLREAMAPINQPPRRP